MKNITILLLLFFSCLVTARADVIVPCLDCTLEQAETKAMLEARDRWPIGTNRYEERFAMVDPVADVVRTFVVRILYEPELGRVVREVAFLTNDDLNIIEAVSTYNAILNDIYEQWVSIQGSNGTFHIYDSDSSFAVGVADAQVERESFLYRMIRGQALYPVPYPSYNWMTSDTANEAAVIQALITLTSADSILSALTNAMKTSLAKLLLDLPLQYTVRFENGDTLAFTFNGLLSDMFNPLHETAQDAAGNRLSGTTRSGGGSGGGSGSGYSGFYSYIDTNGLFLRRICTTAFTGPPGSTEPTLVCYMVYL